jgi:hypothetical protein
MLRCHARVRHVAVGLGSAVVVVAVVDVRDLGVLVLAGDSIDLFSVTAPCAVVFDAAL